MPATAAATPACGRPLEQACLPPWCRRYYLNGNDAYRLKLLLPPAALPSAAEQDPPEQSDVWAAQQLQQLSLAGQRESPAQEGQEDPSASGGANGNVPQQQPRGAEGQ